MINRIRLLRNIGQFDNVRPPQHISFSPVSLLYGENGRGKTTIAELLRSLATNDPVLIEERQRLGSQYRPHVVIDHVRGQSVFQNGAWTGPLLNIAIFDDAFVSANVCSGIEIQSAHRQGLHELILGSQGVARNNTLQDHVRRVEEHNVMLRELAGAIPANVRGSYDVDAFCNLVQDHDIDTKLQDANRRLAAAQSEDTIRHKPGFQSFVLPNFDRETIDAVLGRSLPELEAEAEERVKTHIANLGRGGESWISDGIRRIEPVSAEAKAKICPFCAQDLEGSQLIRHYRAYFSQAYEELKVAINQTWTCVRDTHGGNIPSDFERNIRSAVQAHEFWKGFVELPQIDVDTAAIAQQWTAARDAVLEQIQAKAAAPLEPMALSLDACQAIIDYHERVEEIEVQSASLIAANAQIDIVKEQARADDLSALLDDLAKLKAQKERYEPAVAPHCDAYLTEKAKKAETEARRARAREALDQYREQIFPAYETTINDYLRRFAASFQLGEVEPVNIRSGSSTSYCVVINQQNVNVIAGEGPCFRNTLSAGDRNTLALAFFFASLEQDPDLASKIIVIDDPITSLDEHRTLRTQEEILAMSRRVQQVIILSHSKPFLCHLWERADKNSLTAIRINRAAVGSELDVWNIRNDSVSEHDKRHELVRTYLQAADPDQERQVATALRPILEFFMRAAYPEHFSVGALLGPFIGICRQRVGTNNEILSDNDTVELSALLTYANRFHHDTNPAYQTAAINDAELSDFADRTLAFASRR